jgi:hypothetical protein
VWIWEKTAIISLYSIKWLVFIAEIVFTARYGLNLRVVYINPSKPSGQYMYRQFNIKNSTFCSHSVFMCFMWIWEPTAIISLYSFDWFFLTDIVFTARNGLNLRVMCISPLKPNGHYRYPQFNIRSFYVLPTQCIYVFLCGPENKQRLFPYTTLTDWFL